MLVFFYSINNLQANTWQTDRMIVKSSLSTDFLAMYSSDIAEERLRNLEMPENKTSHIGNV